jgi:hypothetical protein
MTPWSKLLLVTVYVVAATVVLWLIALEVMG